jgi:hypothetical protein
MVQLRLSASLSGGVGGTGACGNPSDSNERCWSDQPSEMQRAIGEIGSELKTCSSEYLAGSKNEIHVDLTVNECGESAAQFIGRSRGDLDTLVFTVTAGHG